jgi:hypothetical protein
MPVYACRIAGGGRDAALWPRTGVRYDVPAVHG